MTYESLKIMGTECSAQRITVISLIYPENNTMVGFYYLPILQMRKFRDCICLPNTSHQNDGTGVRINVCLASKHIL